MSTKKSIDLPATWSITLGSAWVIGVPESGGLQSSSKTSSCRAGSGFRVILGRSGPLPLGVRAREAEGQSLAQCPRCLHFGQGLVGGLGLGHILAQCSSLLHLKQAPGGWGFLWARARCRPQGCYHSLGLLVEEAGLEFGLLSQPGFTTSLCSLFPGVVNFKGHFYQVSYGSLRATLSLGQFFFFGCWGRIER